MKVNILALFVWTLVMMGCSSKESAGENKSEAKSGEIAEAVFEIPMEIVNGESFVDSRDNQVYRYVKIGDAVWMKDNLRFASSNSFCNQKYGGGCEKVGRYYAIEELPSLCPEGWRLPRAKDFNAMQKNCKKNPGFCLWHEFEKQGSDEIGFSALALGRYDMHVSKFSEVGERAYFWGETNGSAKDVFILKKGEYASSISRAEKSDAFTVRCVKN